MKMTFEVERVSIVRVSSGTDRIVLYLPDADARRIHGPKYDIFRRATLDLECTRGRAEEVLKALGIPDDIVELIEEKSFNYCSSKK